MSYSHRALPLCAICLKPANQFCSACKLVHYCSRGHQKLDWREGHKFKCRAFKVQYSDTLGRHMIATRDIQQGEMILKEKPAVIGPKTSSYPTCLGCHKKVNVTRNADGSLDYPRCALCEWPMCNERTCQNSEVHREECEIMSKRKFKCTIKYEGKEKNEAAYCVITPLRIFIMKDSNPQQYQNIMNLESHLEERLNSPLYTVLKANLITFFQQVLGFSELSDEVIMTVASILDTNAFDVRVPSGGHFRAIYVTASMMAHDCKPNTRHIFTGTENLIAVIATVPIAKGDLITATYTNTLQGTLDRRSHLINAKCFDCECDRCRDVTEFGTYIGSIYCSVCIKSGVSTETKHFPKLISVDPLDSEANWKCEQCNHYILSKQMKWGNNAIKQELAIIDRYNPAQLQDFIEKYKHTLHPSNFHIIQAKYALTQIYGNTKGYEINGLKNDLLSKKISLCYELLELADKVEPGLSRFRGVLLLDLQEALTVQTKRDFESQRITKVFAQEKLMESMKLLQEAAEILKVEPNMKDSLEKRIEFLTSQIEVDKEKSQETTGEPASIESLLSEKYTATN